MFGYFTDYKPGKLRIIKICMTQVFRTINFQFFDFASHQFIKIRMTFDKHNFDLLLKHK